MTLSIMNISNLTDEYERTEVMVQLSLVKTNFSIEAAYIHNKLQGEREIHREIIGKRVI